MKADEIRKLTKEQRKEKLEELKLELSKLLMQARVGTLENPKKIKVIRKTIARILTIEREEELKNKGGKQ